MREIVLDTETTGLDPLQGHRLVEVGCIELLNRIPTGATFHSYLNPEREVPAEAFAIHGLATEFLKDNPRRSKHGALLDAEILAEVYLELIGARQAQLGLAESGVRRGNTRDGIAVRRERDVALAVRVSAADRAAHRKFVATLGANAVWRDYLPDDA